MADPWSAAADSPTRPSSPREGSAGDAKGRGGDAKGWAGDAKGRGGDAKGRAGDAKGRAGDAKGRAGGAGAAVDLGRALRVHLVGAGGSGMSGIATLLLGMGHTVTGTDLSPSAFLDRLRRQGATVTVGHDPAAVVGADVVAVSTAVPATNPELTAALQLGIPVLSRAEILAAICASRRILAVAGTKGKTTTAAMLAAVLDRAGWRPSYLVGGELHGQGGGARWVADSDWLVVEADESDGTFLTLGAEAVIVTNVQPDHLDFYGSLDGLHDAFARFVAAAPGPRVVCADDPGAASLVAAGPATTYGTSSAADVRMSGVMAGRQNVAFDVTVAGRRLGRVALGVPGVHNARNACAALAVALELGVGFDTAALALGAFREVARRWDWRGERDGVSFVDDYAHLPSALEAVLQTARDGGWGRVVAVFQPHRYSRTEALHAEFADAFAGADVVVLTDIYAAGEAPRPGVSGRLVFDAVVAAHPDADVRYVPERAALAEYVAALLRPGDLCLTLSAGDLNTLPDELMARAGW